MVHPILGIHIYIYNWCINPYYGLTTIPFDVKISYVSTMAHICRYHISLSLNPSSEVLLLIGLQAKTGRGLQPRHGDPGVMAGQMAPG